MTEGTKMKHKLKTAPGTDKAVSGMKQKKLGKPGNINSRSKMNTKIDKKNTMNQQTEKKLKSDGFKTLKNNNNNPKVTGDVKKDKNMNLKTIKKFKQKKALQQKQNMSEINKKQFENKHTVTSHKNVNRTDFKKKNKQKRNKKDSDSVNTKKSAVAGTSSLGTTDSKDSSTVIHKSEKKRLKVMKWKQKQMAQKLERKQTGSKKSGKIKEAPVKGQTADEEKIQLPKSADEATVNWKKLQETLQNEKVGKKKRKIPDDRIRNPKHRKVDPESNDNDKKDNQTDKEPEIWFDDVDEILLDKKLVDLKSESETGDDKSTDTGQNNPLIKPGAFKGLTKIVCMDCEMVGVGDGSEDMLARVSIVNQFGEPVYDAYVKPKEEVVDYRTFVSGIRPQDLKDAEEFEKVQKDVGEILKGKVLVGHSIKNDLKVLYLRHPRKRIRDTSMYKPFRQLSGGRTPSLKKLSEKVLGVKVQEGEHDSIQDAQATMRLYTMYRMQWEKELLKAKREGRQKAKKT